MLMLNLKEKKLIVLNDKVDMAGTLKYFGQLINKRVKEIGKLQKLINSYNKNNVVDTTKMQRQKI